MSTPPPATVREIAHDSPEYHAVRQARDRILRRPLGLRLSGTDLEGEDLQRHFILESSDRLLGSVIVLAETPTTARLRQMWIEPERAGQGLGRHLLAGVLATLRSEGFEEAFLHARKPVFDFYRKCGFVANGPEFFEVGIPHRRMRCRLSPGKRSPGDRR